MTFSAERFRSEVQRGGLVTGLQLLNEPVEHRYTGIYRLEQGVLKSVELVDKDGEIKPEFLSEVPLEDSFCQFVLRDGLFRTSDTGKEPMLIGHKYQGVLLSYTGVPIVGEDGSLYGTLCHFDALRRELSEEDFEHLKVAARMIPEYLPR